MSRTRLDFVRTRALPAAMALLAAVVASFAGAASATAAEHSIVDGRLDWGVKESWREYIGAGSEAGGGAEVTGWALNGKGQPEYAEGFSFPIESGSFDDGTDTTVLQLGGWVHFQAYCDAEGEGCLLDTKFSNLELEIDRDAQVLRGTHTGYSREDPGGALHEDADLVLTKLDILEAATDFSGGESRWTGIPTVAGPGNPLYGEGTVLDPVSFEYTGPGGVPDLSEKWDTPGAPGLAPGDRWLSEPTSSARVLHAGADGELVHTVDLVGAKTVDAKLLVAALDAETLEPVGTPHTWVFPGALKNDRQELRTAYDPATESVYFVTFNEGEARNLATVRRAEWDGESQSYAVEEVGSLGALTSSRRVYGLAWNPIAEELAVIAYSGGTADKYETDTLHRFHLDEGSWVHEQTPLRVPDDGEWEGATSVSSPFNFAAIQDYEPLAVARDGSYVAASGTGNAVVSSTKRYYPALHVAVSEGGTATVSPIPGTRPTESFGYYGYSSLAVDDDGSLLLHNSSQHMDSYVRIDVEGGEAVKVGDTVRAPADVLPPFEYSGFANAMVVDGGHGIAWASDTTFTEGFHLAALIEDEIAGRYVFSEFPETSSNGGQGRLEVAPDGALYLPVKDPESGRLGYRRLAFTGFVPELIGQPEDELVQLFSGEASKEVEFAVAIADEDDSIQWQRKAPGAAAFADVEGATDPTLEVEATPAGDGSVYRAKVSNGAGAIVSEEATLEVEYAPLIVNDLVDREVSEGTDAVFLLSADASPDAEVEWQRRVGGFWQPVSPGDDNFEQTGGSLTVLGTNTEQSGSLFRAKLSNAVGTTYSKQAKLTVTPRAEVPDGGVDVDHVSLDWTGNAEMQHAPPYGGSNYFSAGVSDGTEATYSAASGNVRVFQLGAGGGEALATWATRAAHVSGGGSQLVRLYEGGGRVEEDGSATVEWEGEFSVNFYGGLVPFMLTDPVLEVDSEGNGELRADLTGCASSQANPNVCEPFPTEDDRTVAEFSGVLVDPSGQVTIEPRYAGVEVEVPEGTTPQNRSGEGWGAWPQQFVDFHVKTGLAPYWYSSGGSFDPDKPPSSLLVDFDGEALPAAPEPEPPAPADPTPAPRATPPPTPAPSPEAGGAVAIRGFRAVRGLNGNRVVRIATLACPEGAGSCPVKVPRRVAFKLAGKRHWARILAPKRVKAGGAGKVRAKLPRSAIEALGNRSVKLEVRIVLRSAGGVTRKVARVRVSDKLKTRTVGRKGLVTLGKVRCESGRRCRVATPKWTRRKVAGRKVAARVIAPRALRRGKSAKVRLKLRAGARKRLAGHSAVFRVKATVRGGGKKSTRVLRARLKRPATATGGGGGGGGGPTGIGGPESAPISSEPPRLARPATAVGVSAVAISWYPRDSWVRYASSGTAAGDGIIVSGGASAVDSTASACPDRPSTSDAVLPYEIRFAPAASWFDPVSGQAGIYGSGSVKFRWKTHTIDLTAADPEIEINGAASRAIFRFAGSEGTAYAEQRADLVSLAAAAPTVTNGGKTYSYSLMRGTLTENGVNVFAGFYTPPDNDEFGCVSVSFTTP